MSGQRIPIETKSIQALQKIWAEARPQGVRALLRGEAGLGKATAATWVASEASGAQAWILVGRPDGVGTPYQAILSVFQKFVLDHLEDGRNRRLALEIASDLLRLLPFLGPLADPLARAIKRRAWNRPQPVNSHFDLAYLLRRILRTMAERAPVVLVLRDIDAFDGSSLSLVVQLASDPIKKVSFLLTVGSTHTALPAGSAMGRRRDTLDLLEREHGFQAVAFVPFDHDETRAFLAQRLGGIPSNQDVNALHAFTGGNALFLEETVASLKAQDLFFVESGELRLRRDPWKHAHGVSSIIDERLAALEADLRNVLDVASVLGAEFPSRPIAGVLERRHLEVLRQLRKLEEVHHFIQEMKRHHRFRHGAVRDLVYRKLEGAMAQEHHLLVAQYLEANPLDGDNDYALHHHYRMAGRTTEAIRCLERAAWESRSRLCHLDAAERFEAAAEARGVLPQPEGVAAQELRLEAGRSLYDAGQYEDAATSLAVLAADAMDEGIRATALLYQGMSEYLSATYEEAQSTLEHLLRDHGTNLGPQGTAQARLALASVLYHAGAWGAARRQYRKVFTYTGEAQAQVHRDALKRVNMFYSMELAAPQLEQELARMTDRETDPKAWEIMHNLACNHLFMGRLDEAKSCFEEVLCRFEAAGSVCAAYPRNNLAIIAILQGNHGLARMHTAKVREAPRSEYDRSSARIHEAMMDVLEGNIDGGIARLEQLLGDVDDEPILDRVTHHNLGWAHTLKGERDAAARYFSHGVPTGDGPWHRIMAGHRQRILMRAFPNQPLPPALQGTDHEFLERTGRADAWVYRNLDYEFSEVWFWE